MKQGVTKYGGGLHPVQGKLTLCGKKVHRTATEKDRTTKVPCGACNLVQERKA